MRLNEYEKAVFKRMINEELPLPVVVADPDDPTRRLWKCIECGHTTAELAEYRIHVFLKEADMCDCSQVEYQNKIDLEVGKG